jgi:PadR family transcriptional regulator AphA
MEPSQTAPNLTATSYLVLGLIEREGSSTPYDLKRHVAATIGHFWSFPHALLYKEPPRLVGLGLLTEQREVEGRRRRLFAITERGREALRRWLASPSQQPTELRDAGLLQLFFADLGSPNDRRALGLAQVASHRAVLAGYERDQLAEALRGDSNGMARTIKHWRDATLPMGLLYERAAVMFWQSVAAGAVDDAAEDRSRTQDELLRAGSTDGWRDTGGEG